MLPDVEHTQFKMHALPPDRSLAQPPLGEQNALDLQMPAPQEASGSGSPHFVKQAPAPSQRSLDGAIPQLTRALGWRPCDILRG